MRHVLALVLVLAALSYGGFARAQGNEFSAPTGGRTALMGNTGVALANDGAAPFLNPATIVRIHDQHLAFSVNFFTLGDTHFSGWHQPTASDTRFGDLALQGTGLSSATFQAIPSTLCLFFTLGDLGLERKADEEETARWTAGRKKLAICLGNIEGESVNIPAISFLSATPSGATQQAQALSRSWNRLHIGPTYSAQVTDWLALGLSLHGVYTSDTYALNGSAITNGAGGPIASNLGTSGDGHSFDLTALLGATLHVSNVTIGASAQLPALHVLGSYSGALQGQVAGVGDTATIATGSGSFSAPPPVRVAMGIGAEWKRFTVEIDESYDFPSSDAISAAVTTNSTSLATGVTTPATSNATYTIGSLPTWNTSAGIEYFLTPTFSLIGGASTNFSTTPPLAPTVSIGNLVQAREQRVSLSFGIGSYGDSGELLIGTQLGYGWGQALAVNPYVLPNNFAAVDTQSYSALLILAGATDLRALRRAVERVENVVTKGRPEENPAPAK